MAVSAALSGPRGALTLQSNGGIVVGQGGTFFLGSARSLVRYDTNGVEDSNFSGKVRMFAGGAVNDLATLPGDKLLVGGDFGHNQAIRGGRVARLNADGSGDTNFVATITGTNDSPTVTVLAPYPDGGVFILGTFTHVNGVSRPGIARLNSDGTLDGGFNPGLDPDAAIVDAEADAEGRLVIVGNFTRLEGVAGRNRAARLGLDGSVDPTFNVGAGPNAPVTGVQVLADGKILISGLFIEVNGIASYRMARLHGGGVREGRAPVITRQPSPIYPVTRAGAKVEMTAIATADPPPQYQWELNGKILPGKTNATLVLLNPVVQSAGFYRVRVTNPLGEAISEYVALTVRDPLSPGALDAAFFPGTGFPLQGRPGPWQVNLPFGMQRSGRLIVGGVFKVVDGQTRNGIAALSPDGALDTKEFAGLGLSRDLSFMEVLALVVQPDGKVVVGGSFLQAEGVSQPYLARYTADGRLDTTFAPRRDGRVDEILLQPDGKIVVGGQFMSVNGVARPYLARLQADGQLDPSFVPGPITQVNPRPIWALARQPDGKIIIGGSFTAIDGVPRSLIARLNPDGSLDPSFAPDWNASEIVLSVEVQRDGRILAAGTFVTGTQPQRASVARLNADGSLDPTFHFDARPISSWYPAITQTLEQPDGKIIVGGFFTFVGGVVQPHLARVTATGALDPTFKPDLGRAPNIVAAMAFQNDKLLIGGEIADVNGIPRFGMARIHLYEDNPHPPLVNARVVNGTFAVVMPWTDPGRTYVLERTDNLIAPGWTAVNRIPGNGAMQQFTDTSLGMAQFYRLRVE